MPMSDIEISALGMIYDAMKAVDSARTEDTISQETRSKLGKLYRLLDSMHSMLIDQQVERYLSKIEQKSADLSNIVNDIQADINGIKGLADTINKAADAIKFIIDTAKTAISIGIL